MKISSLETLILHLSRLPGLGPRSARRLALHLLKKRESLAYPLMEALKSAADAIKECSSCGNWDEEDPCSLCTSIERENHLLCVVESISDLWALERMGEYKGGYHILGGTLSALDGRGPEDLKIEGLVRRIKASQFEEIILALNATIEGQTTAHYLKDYISQHTNYTLKITHLAYGVPLGGELDYLDDGTLMTALKERRFF
ncbi:MAG: recombination protein RecR [Proteobacteria bacterium]|nr:recombination protein RecR [Pseudomonadota bacterium]